MEQGYVSRPLRTVVRVRRIVTVHYFEFDRRFRSQSESHDFFELVYLDKGRIAAEANGRRTVLEPGDCVLHAPGVLHALAADGARAPNVFIISFVCASRPLEPLANRLLHLPPACRRTAAEIIAEAETAWVLPYNDPQMKQLTPDPLAPPGAEQMVQIGLEKLLIQLLREQSALQRERPALRGQPSPAEKPARSGRAFQGSAQSAGPALPQQPAGGRRNLLRSAEAPSARPPLAEAVLLELERHLYEKYTVEQLCRTLSFSRAYLSRVFLAASGLTIAEALRNLKIEEARRLMRAGDDTLAQISDRLGFANAHAFSRTFRTVMGMSPTEYRRSIRP